MVINSGKCLVCASGPSPNVDGIKPTLANPSRIICPSCSARVQGQAIRDQYLVTKKV